MIEYAAIVDRDEPLPKGSLRIIANADYVVWLRADGTYEIVKDRFGDLTNAVRSADG